MRTRRTLPWVMLLLVMVIAAWAYFYVEFVPSEAQLREARNVEHVYQEFKQAVVARDWDRATHFMCDAAVTQSAGELYDLLSATTDSSPTKELGITDIDLRSLAASRNAFNKAIGEQPAIAGQLADHFLSRRGEVSRSLGKVRVDRSLDTAHCTEKIADATLRRTLHFIREKDRWLISSID
jgi:hypothetical protein